jgi:predicted acetyltransferase
MSPSARTYDIRPATEQEMGQLGLLTSYVYGGAFGDGEDNAPATNNRAEWTLCAFDGPKMVASYGAIPFTMRANGTAMAVAGVSVVGTLPEYRRQGLLRSITERSLQEMRERGQTVAALWASQAAIYQRYGYSLGTVMHRYEIDTVDVNLLVEPDPSLVVERQTPAESFDTIKAIYRRFVADRTLYLHRSSVLWQANVLAASEADGPAHVALCRDADGTPAGYAVYTLRSAKVDHPARSQEIRIRDVAWLHIDAYRALWSYLARHDLVGRILWHNAPADDPAPELVVEPRMLHTSDAEGVYFRVVDVAAALGARGYDSDGELSIGILADRETPWNEGSYRLTVSDGQAEVASISGPADLTFSIKSLASAFTGFRRVRQLANWGFVDGDDSAIERADRLLATRHAPHSPDHF